MIRSSLLISLVCATMTLNLVAAHNAAAGAQIIGPASSQLSLEIGKGSLIRLDGPAASVFIADPKIADVEVKSPTLVYVIGKAAGQTTLFAVNEHDAVLANIGVSVHFDEAELRQDLRRLLPNSDVGISTSNNSLVLSGTAASAADSESAKEIAARFAPDVEHVVNTMQVSAPNQVNLRVRIAEVSRDVIKQFGFTWGGTSNGPGHFTVGGSNVANLANAGGAASLFANFATSNVDLNVLVDALDSEGLVNVLAEPNLTAVSGAPASFLAGGEFPIPVPQGLNVTTIDYKKFGVSLSFVATITDGGRINLVVKPEVSELSTAGSIQIDGITVPSLTTRRTETTVDLASGQSFAIAGLLQNNVTQSLNKFPGLGNLPILGALFRSDKFERNESELVIIVTPYIVQPTSNQRLASPTDGYIAPTDGQRMVNGADYMPTKPRRTNAPAPASGRSLIGPVGFDLQ